MSVCAFAVAGMDEWWIASSLSYMLNSTKIFIMHMQTHTVCFRTITGIICNYQNLNNYRKMILSYSKYRCFTRHANSFLCCKPASARISSSRCEHFFPSILWKVCIIKYGHGQMWLSSLTTLQEHRAEQWLILLWILPWGVQRCC